MRYLRLLPVRKSRVVTSTSAHMPGSAPTPRTRLIGRDAEIATARSLLLDDAVPLLTLTGPGGVGKTRLALATVAGISDRFTDGVIWLDLSPLADASLIATTLIRALGLVPAAHTPPMETLVRHLRSRQTLLLFDNCEHLLTPTADLIAHVLSACPSVQVLATSRVSLRLQTEQILPVEPLALPASDLPALDTLARNASVQLFVERTRAVSPAFQLDATNAHSVAEVCRQLDGLPLALELAAARSALLPPAALLTHMGDRLRLLRGGARDLPARQRTIREAIAWSYGLLTSEQQAFFRRLAVFPGGFTLDAAESVFQIPGGDERDVLDTLGALMDASLVKTQGAADQPRFGMFETIRAFALDRLRASGEEDEARKQHAAWCLALAEREAPPWVGDLMPGLHDHLEADHDNLRAALAWYEAQGDGATALRMTGALGMFWLTRGYLGEGRHWVARALNTRADVEVGVVARALHTAGTLAMFQGEYGQAETHLVECLDIQRGLGDVYGAYAALTSLAGAAEYQGNVDRAKALYEEALALGRAASHPTMIAFAVANLADIAYQQNDLDRALALSVEGVTLCRHIDQWGYLALSLCNLAQVELARGRRTESAALYDESLSYSEAIRSSFMIADALSGFAAVALADGQPVMAARLLGAVQGVCDACSHPVLPHHFQHRRALQDTRAALADDIFTAAWEAGRGLPLDTALTEAHELAAVVREETNTATRAPQMAYDLSLRELDVLRLLVAGRSNAEIAERLFISRRTATTHISRIYAKLDVASRAEAIALAHRHGLV